MAFMVICHNIPAPADEASLAAYITNVISLAAGGSALLGMLSVMTLAPFQVGKRWRDPESPMSPIIDNFGRSVNRETSPLLGTDGD